AVRRHADRAIRRVRPGRDDLSLHLLPGLRMASSVFRSSPRGDPPALLLRLLQIGLGLRELGPRAAVGELEHLAIVAARGGRLSCGGFGIRRAGMAVNPSIPYALRR